MSASWGATNAGEMLLTAMMSPLDGGTVGGLTCRKLEIDPTVSNEF